MPTVGAPDFDCTFCRIVAGRAPARWVSAPDPDTQARLNAGWSPGLGSGGAACFTNRLRWERVMLLVVPLGHLTQQEMWRGSGIGAVAKLAVEIGLRQCPEGFRLLSNFGRAAHQSQPHAHLHIVSGIADDLESAPRTGTGHSAELQPIHVSGVADSSAPLTLILAPEGNASQIGFWESTLLTSLARKAVDFAEARSPAGYRFVANFLPASEAKNGGPQACTSRPAGNWDCTCSPLEPERASFWSGQRIHRGPVLGPFSYV